MTYETEELVIGVDGGGTKTVCWIATAPASSATPSLISSPENGGDGCGIGTKIGHAFDVLGKGHGGPSNPRAVGLEAACAAIDESIASAFQNAEITRNTIARCVVGLAGAADQTVQASIRDWLNNGRIAKSSCVVPDYDLVLAAGSPSGIGIALIAGTGSLAFGRNAEGETARAGGWGYLLGDDGGGFAIGREAVRTLLTEGDEGMLGERFDRCLLQHFQASAPPDVVSTIYTSADPRTALAEVAPLVLQLAEEGDETALEIVENAAQNLAELVVRVARRIDLDRSLLRLAGTGGVLLGSETLRCELHGALIVGDIETEFTLVPEPVAGAVTLALRR